MTAALAVLLILLLWRSHYVYDRRLHRVEVRVLEETIKRLQQELEQARLQSPESDT